ncbi:hypothetical protein MU582_01900 [Nocardioidaceae bacterium SCSIO 66511]|nr:hypothetical protein MU582_01900 [Nocardioidaceae bacterium SCSIO 66511]
MSRRTPLAAVAIVGLFLSGCADGGASGESEPHSEDEHHSSAVECGASTYEDGHQVIRYCGDGAAHVRVAGGEAAPVRGATCEAHGNFITANFGTNYSNPKAAEGGYVGVVLGDVRRGQELKPATLTGVELVEDGRRVAVSGVEATAALVDDTLRATISGRTAKGRIAIETSCPVA